MVESLQFGDVGDDDEATMIDSSDEDAAHFRRQRSNRHSRRFGTVAAPASSTAHKRSSDAPPPKDDDGRWSRRVTKEDNGRRNTGRLRTLPTGPWHGDAFQQAPDAAEAPIDLKNRTEWVRALQTSAVLRSQISRASDKLLEAVEETFPEAVAASEPYTLQKLRRSLLMHLETAVCSMGEAAHGEICGEIQKKQKAEAELKDLVESSAAAHRGYLMELCHHRDQHRNNSKLKELQEGSGSYQVFYEPLGCLDKETRRLCKSIIDEQVKHLFHIEASLRDKVNEIEYHRFQTTMLKEQLQRSADALKAAQQDVEDLKQKLQDESARADKAVTRCTPALVSMLEKRGAKCEYCKRLLSCASCKCTRSECGVQADEARSPKTVNVGILRSECGVQADEAETQAQIEVLELKRRLNEMESKLEAKEAELLDKEAEMQREKQVQLDDKMESLANGAELLDKEAEMQREKQVQLDEQMESLETSTRRPSYQGLLNKDTKLREKRRQRDKRTESSGTPTQWTSFKGGAKPREKRLQLDELMQSVERPTSRTMTMASEDLLLVQPELPGALDGSFDDLQFISARDRPAWVVDQECSSLSGGFITDEECAHLSAEPHRKPRQLPVKAACTLEHGSELLERKSYPLEAVRADGERVPSKLIMKKISGADEEEEMAVLKNVNTYLITDNQVMRMALEELQKSLVILSRQVKDISRRVKTAVPMKRNVDNGIPQDEDELKQLIVLMEKRVAAGKAVHMRMHTRAYVAEVEKRARIDVRAQLDSVPPVVRVLDDSGSELPELSTWYSVCDDTSPAAPSSPCSPPSGGGRCLPDVIKSGGAPPSTASTRDTPISAARSPAVLQTGRASTKETEQRNRHPLGATPRPLAADMDEGENGGPKMSPPGGRSSTTMFKDAGFVPLRPLPLSPDGDAGESTRRASVKRKTTLSAVVTPVQPTILPGDGQDASRRNSKRPMGRLMTGSFIPASARATPIVDGILPGLHSDGPAELDQSIPKHQFSGLAVITKHFSPVVASSHKDQRQLA
eukprot:TRINITY_DN3268_c0_g1_i1.p1 TRINITY_DN3268_c0_g1~~TRINITY_DN3268_c0_g1_i1.p1  ORF type:complete len:1029 (-),score=206.47 TRINITY_DN3268_c0_g1_i1:144-3230(-)